MGLNGSLEQFSIQDVLQILALGRKTGQLSLATPAGAGAIVLRAGRVVASFDDDCSSPEASLSFGSGPADAGLHRRIVASLARLAGPGYGRLLMRRVSTATGGRSLLAPGSVYPALKALEKARLVRKWTVVVGKQRGGRSRTYYELTVAGMQEAEAEAVALARMALAGRPPKPSPAERVAMRERVERLAELFEFLAELRGSIGCAGHGR